MLMVLTQTFHEQFLCAQIPKAQMSIFFALSGSLGVKGVREMLVKLTPGHASERRKKRDLEHQIFFQRNFLF
jgi:hypothetical protein